MSILIGKVKASYVFSCIYSSHSRMKGDYVNVEYIYTGLHRAPNNDGRAGSGQCND